MLVTESYSSSIIEAPREAANGVLLTLGIGRSNLTPNNTMRNSWKANGNRKKKEDRRVVKMRNPLSGHQAFSSKSCRFPSEKFVFQTHPIPKFVTHSVSKCRSF